MSTSFKRSYWINSQDGSLFQLYPHDLLLLQPFLTKVLCHRTDLPTIVKHLPNDKHSTIHKQWFVQVLCNIDSGNICKPDMIVAHDSDHTLHSSTSSPNAAMVLWFAANEPAVLSILLKCNTQLALPCNQIILSMLDCHPQPMFDKMHSTMTKHPHQVTVAQTKTPPSCLITAPMTWPTSPNPPLQNTLVAGWLLLHSSTPLNPIRATPTITTTNNPTFQLHSLAMIKSSLINDEWNQVQIHFTFCNTDTGIFSKQSSQALTYQAFIDSTATLTATRIRLAPPNLCFSPPSTEVHPSRHHQIIISVPGTRYLVLN